MDIFTGNYSCFNKMAQVREIGKLLGVPASFVSRHPFPGPGLAVRILGDVTQGNALETIRLVRLDLALCLQLV